MTIKAIKTLTYDQGLEFRDNPDYSSHLKETFNNIFFISVTSSGLKPIWDKESFFILPLVFDDVDLDEAESITMFQKYKDELTLFDMEQAKKVVFFIKRARGFPGNNLLLINCFAGVSRSGAIASYAADYCNISQEFLMKINPQINPNKYILRLLKTEQKYYKL